MDSMKTNINKPDERRQDKRYEAKDTIFVIHSENIGRIKNISMGGLYCSCLFNPNTPEEATEFDIFCHNNSPILKKIPFKKIFTSLDCRSPFSMLLMRKCGVKLLHLNSFQKSRLEYLILHHTDIAT